MIFVMKTMKKVLPDPIGVYAILDTSFLAKEAVPSVACRMAYAGVRVFQVRAKPLSARDFFSVVKKSKDVLPEDCILIANDRADVALCSECDGVHLGQEDIGVDAARLVLGAERIVGISTHTLDEVERANSEPCDYIAFGPVFETKTKHVETKPHGLEGLRQALMIARKPVVAIGGIELNSVQALRQVGVSGVAMISALLRSDDIFDAAERAVRAFFAPW
jgi:thiamine-phosphate pyrophosphorylase